MRVSFFTNVRVKAPDLGLGDSWRLLCLWDLGVSTECFDEYHAMFFRSDSIGSSIPGSAEDQAV